MLVLAFAVSGSRLAQAVVISDIANIVISEDDVAGPIQFSLSQFRSANPTITGESSDATLVSPKAIVIGGSGGSRTVTVTPNANRSGSTVITLTVTDLTGTDTETFTLTVRAVNDAPTVDDLPNQSIDEDKVLGPIAFRVGDVETPAAQLTLTRSTTNPTLVPEANIVFGGSGENRTLIVTPASNQSGTAVIGVFVSDGSLTSSVRFTLEVKEVNDAPIFSDIADRSISEDSDTGTITFNLTDAETSATGLKVTARSSNQGLVPDGNIVLGTVAGATLVRTVKVTPLKDQTGQTIITLTGTDGINNTDEAFVVTVSNVNDSPTISDLPDQSLPEDGTTGALPVIVGDIDTPLGSLQLTATSSNEGLLPLNRIVFGGSGANRTVTISPAANQSGESLIVITVSDGSATAIDRFNVRVSAVNDPPTISDIPNLSIQNGSSSGAVPFTLSDPDTATDALRVTVVSTDTVLLPNSGIVFGGSGANRTVTLTPAGTQAGVSIVTVTVTDGSLTASDTFVVTVSTSVVAPKIEAPPSPLTVFEGETATFEVKASGTEPFRYQWFLNGRELADGTGPSFIVRNAQLSQAGDYTVRVSNAGGSATSSAGKLTVQLLDYGDTPDGDLAPAYPTRRSRDGARHVIADGFALGKSVDSETDALISASATGDDAAGTTPDDEDGVEFLTLPLVAGQTAQVRVTLLSNSGVAGRLDAFVDFNGDGVWSVPSERIFSGQALSPGANTLSFSVPLDVKGTSTFARFRLSRQGGLGPTGIASEGEVEDYLVRVAEAPPPEDLVDFGDAPESSIAVLYRTRLSSGGPRHRIVSGFYLGKLVDAEKDGQPNADATGDDAVPSNADDEDGVVFASAFEAGKPATLLVTSSSQGILDGWFDFNRASGFEAGERAINRFPLIPGVNSIVVQVPANAAAGDTFARFRLTRNGVDSPDSLGATALLLDGEVEDYKITIREATQTLDFGDAPEGAAGLAVTGYPTTLQRNGARHLLGEEVFLGNRVDPETDGQPDTNATGDDLNPASSDDEDGVVFLTALEPGKTAQVSVTSSRTARLDAWVDFDGNRSWGDAGEQIFASQIVAGGLNTLNFQVPASAKRGTTFARFRLSTDGKQSFVGQARDGEVEDYSVEIETGAPCDVNYKGREFWLTFPGNYPQGPKTPLRLTLCIVGPQGITGTVSIPGLKFTQNFTLPAAMKVDVTLPDSASLGDDVDVVRSKGIHVEASGPVAVYGLNRIPFSSDGFLGLPIEALGTDYLVTGYPNVFSAVSALNGTQFSIVATEDETAVTVIPSRNVLGHPKGESFVVNLKRGQTYQLRDPDDATADLTGTEVHSNKPIAVFGGHQCANIDSPSKMFCDHLVEQLLPLTAWSKIFYAVPLATRSGGDVLRVVGSIDKTQIFVNGVASGTVDRGQVRTFNLATSTRIDASRPVFVAQQARSSDADGVENADPFMVTVPPVRFYTKDHMICTGPASLATHHVNIVAPSSVVGSLTLNGVPVPAGSFSPIGASGFSSARITVPAGAHALSASQAFGTIVYGFGPYEGYGWPGGMYFGDIVPPVIVCPDDVTVQTGAVAGTSAASKCVALVPDLRSKIVVIDNCATATQRPVEQTPAPGTPLGPGKYVINFEAQDAAGNEASCSINLTVVDPGPATIVCPKDFTVICNKGAGAAVAYQVIARTECGTVVPVECNPPSGAVFLPGVTTVVCRIKDQPNQTCSFKVTVVCPDTKNLPTLPIKIPALQWDGSGVLETAFSLDGPWTEVPAAASPFEPAALGERQFFRLRSAAEGVSLHGSASRPSLRVNRPAIEAATGR